MNKVNAFKCIINLQGHKPFVSHVRSIDTLRTLDKKYSNRSYTVLGREVVLEHQVNSWFGVNTLTF